LPLWNTTKEVFFHCGIQRKSFFTLWDTTEKVFLRCGIQHKRIFSIVGYNGEQSQDGKQILFYCMEDIFLRCGIQRKRFFFVVGYNGRSFPPLWDTMEEVFSFVGYNGRGFFRCGIQWKKTYNAE
jgi:hypothetical protein